MINIDCEKQDNSGKISGGKDDRGDHVGGQETQDGNEIESDEEESINYKHRTEGPTSYRDYDNEGVRSI